jgi:hypothetical protein
MSHITGVLSRSLFAMHLGLGTPITVLTNHVPAAAGSDAGSVDAESRRDWALKCSGVCLLLDNTQYDRSLINLLRAKVVFRCLETRRGHGAHRATKE